MVFPVHHDLYKYCLPHVKKIDMFETDSLNGAATAGSTESIDSTADPPSASLAHT